MLTILCRVGEGQVTGKVAQKKHGGEKERQQHKVIARDGEALSFLRTSAAALLQWIVCNALRAAKDLTPLADRFNGKT